MTRFPTISVMEAYDRLGRAYIKIGTGADYDRRAVANALGYTNPKSGRLSVLMTNVQLYGLIERSSDRYSFTQRFTDYFTAPQSVGGRKALLEASLAPVPFRTLFQSFKDRRLPTDAANWLLHQFHGDITLEQAQAAVKVFIENAVAAGIYKDGVLADVFSDNSTAQDPTGSALRTLPKTPQEGEIAGVQRNSADFNAAAGTSAIEKDFGNGRIARVVIPADLTQEERDNLMALIQYL